jgi:hypothetical protein
VVLTQFVPRDVSKSLVAGISVCGCGPAVLCAVCYVLCCRVAEDDQTTHTYLHYLNPRDTTHIL